MVCSQRFIQYWSWAEVKIELVAVFLKESCRLFADGNNGV